MEESQGFGAIRRLADGADNSLTIHFVTIAVAPKAALAPTGPPSGFSGGRPILVIDRPTLDNAKPYSELITHTVGQCERLHVW